MDKTIDYLFPYKKWRKGQRELTVATYNAIKNGKILLVSYPTGAGKTLAVLMGAMAALNNNEKIVYLARTKNQFQAPFREIIRLTARKGGMAASMLVNKRDACLLRGVSSFQYNEFLRFCSKATDTGMCPYRKGKYKGRIPPLLDLKEAKKLGRRKIFCPYEILKTAVRDSNIIIAAYNYIFDKELRHQFLGVINRELSDIILILDEAHNLPRNVSNILTRELRREWIIHARKEVRKYCKSDEANILLSSLTSLLSYFKYLEERLGEKSLIEIESDEILTLTPSLQKLFQISKAVESGPAPVLSYARRIAEFINFLLKIKPGYTVVAERENGAVVIKILNIVPAIEVRDVFASIKSAILMSGTMPPKDYLISTLGLDEKRIIEANFPQPFTRKAELYLFKGITSKYSERDEKLFIQMASIIDYYFNRTSEGIVLTVFPSYNFMKRVRPKIASTPVFVEREDTTLRELLNIALKERKILVLSVAWGKLIEGIEIRVHGKSLIKTVIVCGLPVPEPDARNRKLLEYLYHKLGNRDRAWKLVYMYPAIVRVIQAIGRGIRSEEDSIIAIVLDDRLLEEEYLETIKKYGYLVEVRDVATIC